jgi:hypothetical protein
MSAKTRSQKLGTVQSLLPIARRDEERSFVKPEPIAHNSTFRLDYAHLKSTHTVTFLAYGVISTRENDVFHDYGGDRFKLTLQLNGIEREVTQILVEKFNDAGKTVFKFPMNFEDGLMPILRSYGKTPLVLFFDTVDVVARKISYNVCMAQERSAERKTPKEEKQTNEKRGKLMLPVAELIFLQNKLRVAREIPKNAILRGATK